MEKKWYQSSYYRTLLDMHIEDWDASFLSEFDPDYYVEQVKKAQIDAVMIYVQAHTGLCYWPTKSGVMHRSFLGHEDRIRRVFDLCHAAQLPTILYYSVIFNNAEYDRHPDWRMRDPNGDGSRAHGSRYGLCCPNNPDYRTFLKEQIREMHEYFDFEGIFYDMSFWPEVCYCPSCRKRYREEFGGEMPTIADWNDPTWNRFVRRREEWMGEFASFLTAEIKRLRPEVSVEHQYSTSVKFWRFGQNDNIAAASDYIGTDLYGGPRQQSLACKAWYHLSRNQPFQYMTSRCYPELAEHTTMKTQDQLEQHVAMTYFHHGAALMIDAIDPSGTVNPAVYELLGRVYDSVKCYRPYLACGKPAADVALYYDLEGKMDVEVNGLSVLDPHSDEGHAGGGTMPHFSAILQASAILANHHIPYEVLNNTITSEIERFRAVLVLDDPFVPEQTQQLLERYAENGGSVLLSGHSAPQLVEKLFGVRQLGYTRSTVTYLSPTDTCEYTKPYFTDKYPLVMFEPAMQLEGGRAEDVLAYLTLPYTLPPKKIDICPTEFHGEDRSDSAAESYPFSSIHSNPPGKWTRMPALLARRVGKGLVMYMAMDIERAERYQHEEVFAAMVSALLPQSATFRTDLPFHMELIPFQSDEENKLLLGMVYTGKDFKIPQLPPFTLSIRLDRVPKRVRACRSGKTLPFTWEAPYASVSVPGLHIHEMLEIER